MNIFIFSDLLKFINSYHNTNKNINYKKSIDDILKDISCSISKNTLLSFAICYELTEDVEYLLQNGSDPNQETDDGIPLLSKACIKNNIDLVHLLVKYGADVKKIDKEGKNALEYSKNKNIEKYLLYKGIQ